MKEFEVPETVCPLCQHPLSRAANVDFPGPPAQGDFTFCFHCGAWLVFSKSLQLRLPLEEEAEVVLTREQRRILSRATELIRRRGGF